MARLKYLGEVDGGDRGAARDRVCDRLGAGLVAQLGEQRGGIENVHLLGGLAGGLGAAVGEQLVDHRHVRRRESASRPRFWSATLRKGRNRSDPSASVLSSIRVPGARPS